MMHYSGKLRGRIFVKGYVFMSFARNMSKTLGKNISNSRKAIQKTAQATCDFIGN